MTTTVGDVPRIDIAERAGVALNGEPRPTEDRVVVVDPVSGHPRTGAVAVLDGATEQRPGLPSGGWYAEHLAARLRQALTVQPQADLATVLTSAIADVADTENLTPGASPSSTVSLLRWDADVVEALVLADSPVVAFGTFGIQAVTDDRLASLRARGALPTLDAVTRLRNRDGGFWVAEADPSAAAQAVRAHWTRDDVDTVLLATDGVSIGVDEYHLFDWAGVRELSRASGPAAVLDTVRAAERADRARTRWPRAKVHDDQAMIVVDFTVRSG
ncbi:hypothetical protein JD82_03864 [Prauserella rugosa]|uniref:Protein phosphatase 2C-like protein n=1 Tax=Prauserella rugosa TaxID=43354 RepID=A0A660CLB8_9PSEU|nr:hypothetical protein JD82_03864 [Prauserella rugosa]